MHKKTHKVLCISCRHAVQGYSRAVCTGRCSLTLFKAHSTLLTAAIQFSATANLLLCATIVLRLDMNYQLP
jgi:hypothetical protein